MISIIIYFFGNRRRYQLVSLESEALNFNGFETLNILGSIAANVEKTSSEIPWGTRNCIFFNSDPPHDAISIMKPLTHFKTSSARLAHQATVIS